MSSQYNRTFHRLEYVDVKRRFQPEVSPKKHPFVHEEVVQFSFDFFSSKNVL